jgi:arylsulfatase A-like enzyme
MGREFHSLPERFRLEGYETYGAGLVLHDVDDAPSWSEPVWHPPTQNAAAARQPDLPECLVGGNNKDWATDEAYELIRQRWRALQRDGYTVDDLADPSVARKAQGPPVEAGEVDDDGYEDGLVTEAAIEWLHTIADEAPFFLAVGYVTGHTPFRAPKKYFDLYDRTSLMLPEFRADPEGSPEWVSGDSEPAQYYTTHGYERPWRANDEQSRELLHGHLAATSYIDAQVGRLLDALEASGRAEETLVVVLSDHGFHDGQHGYWGKHNLWDRSLHVPFVVRLPPGIGAHAETPARGRVVEGLTEHVDVYPTLCDLCRLEKPEHLEGESLVQLLSNPDGPGKRAVISHRKHMWHDRIKVYEIAHSIRTERYRYTEYRNSHGTPIYRELFDYEIDPHERKNRIDQPAYQTTARELESLLASGL